MAPGLGQLPFVLTTRLPAPSDRSEPVVSESPVRGGGDDAMDRVIREGSAACPGRPPRGWPGSSQPGSRLCLRRRAGRGRGDVGAPMASQLNVLRIQVDPDRPLPEPSSRCQDRSAAGERVENETRNNPVGSAGAALTETEVDSSVAPVKVTRGGNPLQPTALERLVRVPIVADRPAFHSDLPSPRSTARSAGAALGRSRSNAEVGKCLRERCEVGTGVSAGRDPPDGPQVPTPFGGEVRGDGAGEARVGSHSRPRSR